MDKLPTLSIVTVCLNSCGTIEQTIKSVLDQEYGGELEYIIIDGGSTDGTLGILEKYRSKFAYMSSEKDEGIYDAMNKGVEKCTGDLIGIINSDDYYLPGAFQVVAEAFLNKDFEGYIFWGDVLYESNTVYKGFSPEKVKSGAFAPHPSMFCPKAVYNLIGNYDLSYRYLADYDFMYRAINIHKIEPIYVPKQIAYYREDGLSSTHVLECLVEQYQVRVTHGQNRILAVIILGLKVLKNIPRIIVKKTT